MEKEYQYMVATICTTYNHASYIKEAFRGFVTQETTFPVLYIVVDDASPDGTQEIIMDYLDESFHEPFNIEDTDDVRVIYANHKENRNCQFAVFLLKYNHQSISKPKVPYSLELRNKAKYHALCEGDDYWTDPLKLQKQVDYMESHSDCGLVHAKAKVYNQKSQSFRGICGEQNGDFEHILIKNPIVTLTACYRTSLFKQYQAEKDLWDAKEWKMGDYPTWIWFAYHSKIFFIDEEVAVYRELEQSASHFSTLKGKLAFIENTMAIQMFFAELYNQDERIKKQISYSTDMKSAIACLNYGDKELAKTYMKRLTIIDRCRLLFRH